MTNPRTYPEFKPRSWGLNAPWTLTQIEKFLRYGMAGLPDSPRYKAHAATLDAVYQLDSRGVTVFHGHKVHALLVQAAREHGWLAPTGKYKAMPPPSSPDSKYCRRCEQEKPLTDFNMVATPAQKRRNGWNMDAQYFVTSLLCAPCRKAKTQAVNRKQVKKKVPDILSAYKLNLSMELESVNKMLTKHTAFITPEGDRVYSFKDEADQAYYFERKRLLLLARERFNSYIDDGKLLECVDKTVPLGAWHGLLTEDERDKLTAIYRKGSWMDTTYRRKMPLLWERKTTVKPKVDKIPVRPGPMPTPPDQTTNPDANTPWSDF